MALRPYQKAALDAAIGWTDKSASPALLELATGAGKSWIIAAIAESLHAKHGGKVLCIQPSAVLAEQNHEKLEATGTPASFYSASLGRSMAHSVVYGTPQTIKNDLRYFQDQFCAVLIDECHETTATVRNIIAHLRQYRNELRVIGVTATPYTMQGGYIYSHEADGTPVPPERTQNAYYARKLYSVHAPELIDQGFLTRPVTESAQVEYDTSGLTMKRGSFTADSVDRAFVGQGRLTASIVERIVTLSQGRHGVMIFAATVQHAKEIMESLPPEMSRMIGGDVNMDKTGRGSVIDDFKLQRFKYLVSVGTLTRGFDATHVDVVAVMRATESPVLFQQIIGRGLRLHEGKSDCLLLDFAGNIERHKLQENLFAPDIKAGRPSSDPGGLEVTCPQCSAVNDFTGRPNPDGYMMTPDGYFAGTDGVAIMGEYGPIPSHFGRRCTGQVMLGMFAERCSYRWTFKECPHCSHENDIAARYCESCKGEVIDPNTKLQEEFQRIKSDPATMTTDAVRSWHVRRWTSNAGNLTVRIDFKTDYANIPAWYQPGNSQWEAICMAVFGKYCPSVDLFVDYHHKGQMPHTITAVKPAGSKYYRVHAYNRPEDKAPCSN